MAKNTKDHIFENIKGELPVLEHLYGVIDSRIQLMDKKIKERFGRVMGNDDRDVLSNADAMNWMFSNHEYFLSYLEEYSKTVNRLLLLRMRATNENYQLMLYLLEKNRFLELDEKVILQIISQYELKDKEENVAE